MVRRPEGLVGGERVLNALLSRESAVDHIDIGQDRHVQSGMFPIGVFPIGMVRLGPIGPRAKRPGHGSVFQYGICIPMTVSAPNAGLE
ncbi:hypothetical protein BRAS3809_2480031 [Bradyrhizobium sp. STM 3809]|nr:hypothetical protein BRAS3809_2480031 [Bradyrhizobium sp. STM 3809]